MGFRMVKIFLTSGDLYGQRSKSNPENFEVEYLYIYILLTHRTNLASNVVQNPLQNQC